MNDNFYKQLMEQSPVGYAYHKIICNETGTPCDYEFVEVNKVFEELMGMKGTDIIGKPITEVLPEIKKNEFDWIACYGKIALKGETKEFEQYSEPVKRWYKVVAFSPEKNYFITHFIDITKEKEQLAEHEKMEKMLQENERYLRSILDTTQDGFWVLGHNGQITDVNEVYCKMTGYTKIELLGMTVSNLEALETPQETEAHIKRVIENRSDLFETRHKKKDGSLIDLEVSVMFMDLDDVMFVCFCRDITERKQAEETLQRFTVELEQHRDNLGKRLDQSVKAISRIGELRDVYTAGHQKKVAALSCAIGSEMGLMDRQINNLSFGALIHDIGKFVIPSDILNKPGKISDLEHQLIQTHVEESYNVVKEIDFPEEIHTMIYQHHERLDGSGYPQRLSGDEIILESRILAVADVVEAMTSHRPYRAALGIDAALEEIELHKGTRFDADVVDICVRLFKEDEYRWRVD